MYFAGPSADLGKEAVFAHPGCWLDILCQGGTTEMNWFRNRTTATKLMLGFGFVVAMLAAVAAVGKNGMTSMSGSMEALYERHAIGMTHLKEAEANLIRISRALPSALLDENEEDVRRRAADMARYREGFRTSFGEYLKRAVNASNIERANRIRKQFDDLIPQQDKIMALALAKKTAEARAGLLEARAATDEIDSAMQELGRAKHERMKESFAEAQKTFDSAKVTLLVLSLAAGLIAFLIGVGLARMIGRPLTKSAEVLNAVADGDFTRTLDIDSRDEVGQMATALNRAVGEIKGALAGIRERTVEVASAAEELASASEELASGAQQQASSLEETSASLEQITSTVKQNADNARQANQLAAGSRETAERGGQIIGSTQSAMNEINASSRKIAEIISTVDEIAFQTNLLALNAAVEAARAGEQGRGFAVVAGEVRNLAQRSAVASKEIKALIQDSVRKVDSGTELVKRSGETLAEIVTSVKRVTDIVSEIAAASSEQATGISQVGQAMTQMDKVTQSNTAQTEQLSATAQNLSEQAGTMQELVARFKLGGETNLATLAAKVSPRRTQPPQFQPRPPQFQPAGRPAAVAPPLDTAASADLTALAGVHENTEGFQEY
jgi:methyl-accepting chemotaxis protein